MMSARRISIRAGFVLLATLAASSQAVASPDAIGRDANGELARYVSTRDASFGWRIVSEGRIGRGEYAEVVLTSQTWRGIPWKHQLVVFKPPTVDPSSRQAFLFIHGGRWKPEYENGYSGKLPRVARVLTRLAEQMRAPVALLLQVPHQPLFERREDALIAYTFDEYLKSGEADWPLLLPMVKSAARGMDAVQALALERWQIPIEKFTVAGASKRGWTTWLTAAVDPRVASVAPMVIDMLNLPAQIELQRATFGELSTEVQDYANIDLPGRIDSERGRNLISMVDPYSYRERLDQPKLILLATNDRYWPLDALKLYWGGLSEPKHVLYVPNQGHGVRDIDRLVGALTALHRYSSRGENLPRLSWAFSQRSEALSLEVQSDRVPHRVLAWTATSATRDFREARWSSKRCRRVGESFRCAASVSPQRYVALYSEVWFRDKGEPAFSASTEICIAGGAGSAQADCSAPARDISRETSTAARTD